MALMQTFESASQALNAASHLNLTNSQQLEMYGLYKQVSVVVGDGSTSLMLCCVL